MKYFSCAYYPEYWGVERVKLDAALMQEAGVNTVRVGEFAWSRLEPTEGVYTFEWLRESLSILGEHGVQVVMCTPSATAPAWLVKQHPEVLAKDKHGREAWFGVRQHTCYRSPVYRRYVAALTERLVKEVSGHSNVIAWQIDNEVGHTIFGLCHCEECQSGFQLWLKNRYGTVERLNAAWGTGFWSMDYSAWEEVRLGDFSQTLGASHVLDSFRFHSEVKADYIAMQAEIIRRLHPGAIVTTNSPSGVSDRHRIFEGLDLAGVDIYPSGDGYLDTSYHSALFRGMKPERPFWVMETGIGGQGYSGAPHNRRLRAQFWSFFAHGAEMMEIFRWRSCLSGYEKDLMGVLGHNGVPRKRYQELKACIAEVKGVSGRLGELPMPEAPVAVVFDHEAHWAFSSGHMGEWEVYEAVNQWAHHAFAGYGVDVDVISTNRDLSGYKVVVVPALTHVSEAFATALNSFAEKGGVVFLLGKTGCHDPNGNYRSEAWPDHLRALAGLVVADQLVVVNLDRGPSAPVSDPAFEGVIDGKKICGSAQHWLADIELEGGTALARFTNSGLEGQPAVVENRFGAGLCLYLGATRIDDETMTSIAGYLLERGGIERVVGLPKGVEVARRGDFTWVINHTAQPQELSWSPGNEVILGCYAEGKIMLAPYDVSIFR